MLQRATRTTAIHGDDPSAASPKDFFDRTEVAAFAFQRTGMPMVITDVLIGTGRAPAEIASPYPFGEMGAGRVKTSIDHVDGSPRFPWRTLEGISTEEPAPKAGAN
jgi:hypothetical protein